MSSIATTSAPPATIPPETRTVSMKIRGPAASGKSTALEAIIGPLQAAGFDVTVADEGLEFVHRHGRSAAPKRGPANTNYEIEIDSRTEDERFIAPPPGPRVRSIHQQRVDDFMRQAGQALPVRPTVPPADVCVLRAKLILEEAFETIRGLGVVIRHINGFGAAAARDITIQNDANRFEFAAANPPNMIEIADGCADLKVVTTGTLSACGISDMAVQQEVDEANLRKFGPGGRRREDGKWLKPADWCPPDIARILDEQSA